MRTAPVGRSYNDGVAHGGWRDEEASYTAVRNAGLAEINYWKPIPIMAQVDGGAHCLDSEGAVSFGLSDNLR